MPNSNVFTVGGTVQAGGGLYIKREADAELLRLCCDGTFAYVLYARQMGKSSLIINVAKDLQLLGVLPVLVDLTRIGTNVTAEAWYLGQLSEVADRLDLKIDLFEWWPSHANLSPPQRMMTFFREVLLREITAPVVIFVDEIDTTLALPFADDYFRVMRAVYNSRAVESEFKRLSFVLTGVATPDELIQDALRTPFNIGEMVRLDDFTIEEAIPLAEGLGLTPMNSREVLGWVISWTAGHPYLTSRICSSVAAQQKASWSQMEIDDLVSRLFFETPHFDNNLQFISDMVTRRAPRNGTSQEVLLIYRDVLLGRPVEDERKSVAKAHLKLAGIVKSQDGMLRIRNAIYRKVFDEHWVNDHLPTLAGKISSWFRGKW